MKELFLKKLNAGELKVGIVGLGYVGVPLAKAYVAKGVGVIGYDVNQVRVDQLSSGISGMAHIDNEVVGGMVATGLFQPTTDASKLKEADAILICVPTPLDNYHFPDLSYVESTSEMLAKHLRKGQLIVLESTTYPGTTDEVMKPILEKSGLKAGEDFALAYSPEREDPGNVDYETSNIPKLVGADNEDERAMAKAVYDLIVETVMVSNARTAEAAKLTENIFRWVNIALVNELKMIFDKMDIDVWEVIEAADSKPFGFMAFYPGPGVGGHCIRIDPYYLTWKAREHGLSTHFIELAGDINIAMPRHCVMRLMEELSLRTEKSLKGAKILLCGMSYKNDIDDIRESPSLELLEILLKHGAKVDYFDPYVPEISKTHKYPQFAGMRSVEWDLDKFSEYDATLVATGHKKVDYEALAAAVPLMVDTRNVSKDFSEQLKTNVVKV